MKRIISAGRGTSDRSSLIHSSLVRSWSVLWTGDSGLSRLTCQAPDGSPGAAIVQDQLHLLPQNPDWENRSTAGEGSPLPRAVASDYGDGVILGAAVVAPTVAIPLQGMGMLIKQQRGTDEPANTSVVLCHGLTTPMNRGCGSYGAVFIPIPSMVEVHKFLFRSDILLCLWKKEREKKEREKGISLFMLSRLVSFTDSWEILEGKG